MQRVEKTVFISHRRTNFACALAIYHHLTQRGYDVFHRLHRHSGRRLRNRHPRQYRFARAFPASAHALKKYQALSIPNDFFAEAMARLENRYLNVPLSAVSHPASPRARQAAARQKRAAKAAAPVKDQQLTAQQWLERGYAAANVDEQTRCYTEAIRLKLGFAQAFNNRGIARRAKGDVEGAKKDFEQARRLKSSAN